MESVLVQTVAALGAVLVLGQLLLSLPAARHVMSYVDRLEGVALDAGGAAVTVVMTGGGPGQNAFLLVNGQQAASFATEAVRINVKAGDLLEIDGSRLDGEASFEVVGVAGGVSAPAVGTRVVTRRGVVSLERVEFEAEPAAEPAGGD